MAELRAMGHDQILWWFKEAAAMLREDEAARAAAWR